MSGIVSLRNTGLIAQNSAAIRQANQKLHGATIADLQKKSSGTLVQLSDDDIKAAYQKSRNEPKTLTVDTSELINDVYSQTRDNITYDVDGVAFTNAEMKSCKEVMKNALAALPTEGSDLDYRDYAAMGIASNLVNSYAKENLTEEQSAVLKKSMDDYLNGLVQAAGQENPRRLSSDAAESLKSQMANLPEKTRNNLLANLDLAVQKGSVVSSASNQELSSSIKSLFEHVDMKDENAVNDVMMQYQKLMTPVYQASGIRNTANQHSLTNVLRQDIHQFAAQMTNAKAVIRTMSHSFSYTV